MTTKEKGKEQTIPDIFKTIASSYLTNNCKNCPFWSITETCDSVPLNCSWLGLYRHYRKIDNSPTADAVQYTLGYQDGFLEGKKICERSQGEWIIVKDERYGDNVKCPFCGKELAGTDLNFCCKCGAKLIGSEKINGGAE